MYEIITSFFPFCDLASGKGVVLASILDAASSSNFGFSDAKSSFELAFSSRTDRREFFWIASSLTEGSEGVFVPLETGILLEAGQ